MPEILGAWVAPILMIPGMALLVISTANRYSQLVIHVFENPRAQSLIRQLRYLRIALAALYAGIGLLALAGLVAGVLAMVFAVDAGTTSILMLILSCAGIACLVTACAALLLDVMHTILPP
jgi:hypothetical protein